MARKGVENRHSETALFAAMCRAVAARDGVNGGPGSDHLAEGFLPPHIKFLIRFETVRRSFKKKNDDLTPGGYEYVLARTAFFDRVYTDALRDGVTQIVLLGAGYDTRAYRFAAQGAACSVFELDMSTTQERKVKCLGKLKIDVPSNVTLVPINFNSDSVEAVLKNAGYDAEKKTLFLWEGVTMYLQPEAVAAMLDFVRGGSAQGSRIAFDYVIQVPVNEMDHYYGVTKFMETWDKHRKEEPFTFTLDEAALESYVSHQGLKLVSHMDDQQIRRAFLAGDDQRVTGFFRFAIAESNPGRESCESAW